MYTSDYKRCFPKPRTLTQSRRKDDVEPFRNNHTLVHPTSREEARTGSNNGAKEPNPSKRSHTQDRHQEKAERGERMTKNKTREGPLPPPDKGVNDARPGLPTPTVRKNVTWVQPEPTTSDITRPQQLSPDTTWAEPSTAKSKLAKGSPGLSTIRDQTRE